MLRPISKLSSQVLLNLPSRCFTQDFFTKITRAFLVHLIIAKHMNITTLTILGTYGNRKFCRYALSSITSSLSGLNTFLSPSLYNSVFNFSSKYVSHTHKQLIQLDTSTCCYVKHNTSVLHQHATCFDLNRSPSGITCNSSKPRRNGVTCETAQIQSHLQSVY
jgi:hypothetical protein